jgi:hypothetical protein
MFVSTKVKMTEALTLGHCSSPEDRSKRNMGAARQRKNLSAASILFFLLISAGVEAQLNPIVVLGGRSLMVLDDPQ